MVKTDFQVNMESIQLTGIADYKCFCYGYMIVIVMEDQDK